MRVARTLKFQYTWHTLLVYSSQLRRETNSRTITTIFSLSYAVAYFPGDPDHRALSVRDNPGWRRSKGRPQGLWANWRILQRATQYGKEPAGWRVWWPEGMGWSDASGVTPMIDWLVTSNWSRLLSDPCLHLCDTQAYLPHKKVWWCRCVIVS